MTRRRKRLQTTKTQHRLSTIVLLVMTILGGSVTFYLYRFTGRINGFFLVWTVLVFAAMVYSAYHGFGPGKPVSMIEIVEESEPVNAAATSADVETRLKQCEELYNKHLLTKEEYEAKRKEILEEL